MNPDDEQFLAEFDARLREARRERRRGTFARGEVARWILLKSELPTDFAYPYRDLLEQAPRQDWEGAVRDVIGRPRLRGGALAIANAAYLLAPDLFDVTSVLRWLNRAEIWRWLCGRPEPETELRHLLADPASDVQDAAGGFLAVVSEASLPEVQQALRGRELHRFGLFLIDGQLQRRWPRGVRHLIFEPDQLECIGHQMEHPTWQSQSAGLDECVWGGMFADWHHVITLEPVPADLGVSLPRLVLVIDLDDAYDEQVGQFIRHDSEGAPLPPESELRMPPLASSHVRLAAAPREAWVQDWGASNGNENLNRLGGLPVFVQDSVHPRCVDCGHPMVHLLSLDSGLRMSAEAPNGVAWWSWGSGGVANGFWCDGCRISCWTHSCT